MNNEKPTFSDAADHWATSFIAAIQAQTSGVIDGQTVNSVPDESNYSSRNGENDC